VPYLELEPGLRIHYLEINTEKPTTVMLLHGLGACAESWGYQFPALSQAGFRILAPDARGFGKSSYPGGRVSVKIMARDMARLFTELDGNHAHVVGISMGGTLALQMAIDYPQMIDKLVLVNTFSALRPHNLWVWIYFILRFVVVHTFGLRTQAHIAARRIFPRPEQEYLRQELINQITQANPQGYRATMRALGLFNLHAHLKDIHSQTFVISGENDSTVPLQDQIKLVKGIKDAKHVIIPKAGHAVTAEKPDDFNRVLIDFLNV
jgi:3-oxoadipate enol-lactonase